MRGMAIMLCLLCLASIMPAAHAAGVKALPTGSVRDSRVYLNGEMIVCSAYNIGGSNYFKLRDLMQELDVCVDYDNKTKTINVDTSRPYTPDGSESIAIIAKEKAKGYGFDFFPTTATKTTATVKLNGEIVNWDAYNIEGNNHFKLRDIGEALDISIEYKETTKEVYINTAFGYGVDPNAPVLPTEAEIEAMKLEIVRLTNVERVKEGLPELQILPTLMDCAQLKANDMVENNYTGHISPTYGSPTEMMRKYVPNCGPCGENLTGDFIAQEAVNGWMNSPGHKANILDKNATHIGIGITCFIFTASYGTQYIGYRTVQQFVRIT